MITRHMRTLYPSRPAIVVLLLSACVLVAIPFSGAVAPVYAAKGDFKAGHKDEGINVAVNKAKLINLNTRLSDIMIADASLADIKMLKKNKLYIVGKKAGNTNLIILDKQGGVIQRLDLSVGLNLESLRKRIHGLYPDQDIRIQTLGQQVILKGTVSDAETTGHVASLIETYLDENTQGGTINNMLKVRQNQQVMLKVRIMEVERDVVRRLGAGPNNNNTFSTINRDDIDNLVAEFTTAPNIQNPFGTITGLLDTTSSFGVLEFVFQALEQKNMLNTLAEPNLTTLSGREASFNVGGEQPFPSESTENGGVSFDLVPFGTNLTFTPFVINSDRIELKLDINVEKLDPASAATLATSGTTTTTVVGRDTRSVKTVVQLKSGSSLMIAGLIESENKNDQQGLPGTTDNPPLNKVAGSTDRSRDERELVIIVTPYLVDGYKHGENASRIKHKGAGNDRGAGLNGVGANAAQDHDKATPLKQALRENLERAYGRKVIKAGEKQKNYGYIIE